MTDSKTPGQRLYEKLEHMPDSLGFPWHAQSLARQRQYEEIAASLAHASPPSVTPTPEQGAGDVAMPDARDAFEKWAGAQTSDCTNYAVWMAAWSAALRGAQTLVPDWAMFLEGGGGQDALGPTPGWGEPARYLTDDRDHEELFDLVIEPGGNGDWYVSVLPKGHTIGPTVRLCTSGGASSAVPGLTVAVSRAYRALLAAAPPSPTGGQERGEGGGNG